jgi:glutamine synthetase
MAINHILPAAIEYKNSLLETISKTKEVFGSLDSCKTEVDLTREISALIEDIKAQSDRLKGKANEAEALADEYEKASAYQKVAKACDELRKPLDRLEELVDNRLWPLPKYRELLFIS